MYNCLLMTSLYILLSYEGHVLKTFLRLTYSFDFKMTCIYGTIPDILCIEGLLINLFHRL